MASGSYLTNARRLEEIEGKIKLARDSGDSGDLHKLALEKLGVRRAMDHIVNDAPNSDPAVLEARRAYEIAKGQWQAELRAEGARYLAEAKAASDAAIAAKAAAEATKQAAKKDAERRKAVQARETAERLATAMEAAKKAGIPFFEMRGMRIGDPLTKEFRYSHCPANDKGKPDTTGHETIEIDGREVYVMYIFKNQKLASVGLSFKPEMFTTIVRVYTEKFGLQPSTTTERMKNRMGAEFLNEKATWKTDSGLFVVEKYGSTVTSGSAFLYTPELMEATEKGESKAVQELKEKL